VSRTMKLRRLLLVLVIVVLGACESKGKPKPGTGSVCERYAELEVRCGGYTGDEAKETLKLAAEYCTKARAGDKEDVMSALIALESECAAKETECAAYEACVEKAKDETDPPGM
jgi:hypothetical protein